MLNIYPDTESVIDAIIRKLIWSSGREHLTLEKRERSDYQLALHLKLLFTHRWISSCLTLLLLACNVFSLS